MTKPGWMWIALMVLLAGCSQGNVATKQAGPVGYAQPAASGSATADPSQPVEPPVAPSVAPAPPVDNTAAQAPVGRVRAVVPSGTPLHVRIDESIDTRRNRASDGFTATLAESVRIDGQVLVPAGTPFAGHVTNAKASGRMKGRASLGLALDSFQMNGRQYRIETTTVDRVSASHKKRNSWLIGGTAGVGAAIGAIAGGGKGALIGAGAGAGAGAGGAALTGKKEVGIVAETPLRFTLRAAVEL